MRKFAPFALVLWLCLFVAAPAYAADSTHTLTIGEHDRLFHLHTPQQSPNDAMPLVIALHPIVSSGNSMRALTGFDALADEMGFAVAYPQALSYYWDDGRAAAGMLADDGDIDEQNFIEGIIADAQQSANIDADRVYLTGWANGGNLAYRLACQMPDQLAGVAIVGSLMWNYQAEDCPDTGTPVNMLIIHGSADSTFQTEGRSFGIGEASEDRVVSIYSLDRTVDFWTERMGCELENAYDHVALTSYACADDTALHLFNVIGGENAWYRNEPDLLLNTHQVDTSAIVANFFMTGQTALDLMTQTPMEPTQLGRSYNLYIPTNYTFDDPMPLVMVLHGRPGNGPGIALITDMNRIAEENGFIAVYPEGLIPPSETVRGWNYVRDIPLFASSDGSAISQRDDVQFLVDLKHDLAELMPIDSSRAYVTGFSNGGFMTQRMACDAAGRFAAFAAVGSALSWGMPSICEGRPPVPMMTMHGTRDVSVPWTGTTVTLSGREVYLTAPLPNTLMFWQEHNGCNDELTLEDLPQLGDSPGTSVSRWTYVNCTEPLEFVAVENGGHNWPGVPDRISEQIAGNVNMDIHAGQVVWDFLQQFTLDEARVEAAAAVATPSAPIVIEERQPSNQESQELANARQVVATLRNGGFVIYFKHGNANADYTDITCATDGALTTTGDNQAGLLYNVITDLQVPIGRVFVQDTCAAQQSLDRALPAPPDDIQAYNEADELQAALSQVPPEGTNTLIIGSGDLLPQLDGSSLNAADTLMALPDGQSYAFLTIATIYDWVALEQLINSTDE
ncbi:MAG: hypothetical protein CL607_03775 [Anaerolineaceae bacterium]|nr:hypothetical protein [Anaerolineaceae bacterium]